MKQLVSSGQRLLLTCQGYLAQAWRGKIKDLILQMSTIIQKWLKLFFGLYLLKPETVEEGFVFDIFADAPENENAIMFADYVVNTYIDDTATCLPEILA